MSRIFHPYHGQNLQNISSPEMNIDRDVVPDVEILGMANSEPKKFYIDISMIVISGLLFLWLLAIFDLLQTAFYQTLNPLIPRENYSVVPLSTKFWYLVLTTIIIFAVIVIIVFFKNVALIRRK